MTGKKAHSLEDTLDQSERSEQARTVHGEVEQEDTMVAGRTLYHWVPEAQESLEGVRQELGVSPPRCVCLRSSDIYVVC